MLRFYLATWLSDPGTVPCPRETRAGAVLAMVLAEGDLPQVLGPMFMMALEKDQHQYL